MPLTQRRKDDPQQNSDARPRFSCRQWYFDASPETVAQGVEKLCIIGANLLKEPLSASQPDRLHRVVELCTSLAANCSEWLPSL
jgi:hypothetical protein